MPSINIVAHRGGAALNAENTLTAFRRAIALGVDEVECDVHLLSDGTVCVFHDFTLQQLTGTSGSIQQLTDVERRSLTVNGSCEAPPRLEELADLLTGTGVRLHLEIKTNGQAEHELELARKALTILREKAMLNAVSAISFDPTVLRPFIDAGVPSGPCIDAPDQLVTQNLDRLFTEWRDCGYQDLSLNASRTPSLFVEKARAAGFTIGVWTVNGPARLSYWLKQPVDYITTDQPDLGLQLRRSNFENNL